MLNYQYVASHRPWNGPARVAYWPKAGSAGLSVCGPNHPDRRELEAFVQDGFQRKHGASVRTFMPVLLALRDGRGQLTGVAGYRPASSGPLYLEQYLPAPIEDLIAACQPGASSGRAAVAEVGNFACRDCATAMSMVGMLREFLLDQGHEWVTFTATRTVRGIMRHLGIRLTELARADKSRIVVQNDEWGGYYATDPRVMLGYIPGPRGQFPEPTWSI